MKTPLKDDSTSFIALEAMIECSMKTIRGKRAMLSSDIAKLYHVSPEYLHKQVSKNMDCFPKSFMFKLNPKELAMFDEEKFPYAFTEPGILMAGGKLKSEQAVKIHIQFIRYFVHLFNQALKDVTLNKELGKLTNDEKVFDLLIRMGREK